MLSEARISGSSSTSSRVGCDCIVLLLRGARLPLLRRAVGQYHAETAAFAGRALDLEPAAHRRDVAVCDVESQARSFRVAAAMRLNLVEALENAADRRRRNANAAVAHHKMRLRTHRS